MAKEKLQIKFLANEISNLTEDNLDELTKFIVLVAQEGFKDNIVSGNFPKKGKE